jgi:mannose/cellobiose epimerase-like protein (N-acyl-D-glucosamine 2-epimerase family)
MMPPLEQYRGLLLDPDPTPNDIAGVVLDYDAMLRSVLELVLERHERTPEYGWVDTKLSVLTGEDFPAEDPVRGRGAIYGWIQGRALESLAGHARWFEATTLPERIEPLLLAVVDNLRLVRARNGGHVFFLMTPDGAPFRLGPGQGPGPGPGQGLGPGQRSEPVSLTEDSPFTFSDLFCAKGLYAAASLMGDAGGLVDAKQYSMAVADALFDGRFASDQQPLDPKNPVESPPGRYSHGPFMIAIGLAALMLELEADPDGVGIGLRLIEHIMAGHVNTGGGWANLASNDYVEFIGDDGRPFDSEGTILGDPGHALEFVGLSLKFAAAARASGAATQAQLETIDKLERAIVPILDHVFGYGLQMASASQRPLGICKLVDLRTRRVVNSDMPWWNLPETMRAALACERLAADSGERRTALRVFRACHNAFVGNYVRVDRRLMAVQTIDSAGRPVDVIPATPDADPGYHTGLSLIDCLRMIGEMATN